MSRKFLSVAVALTLPFVISGQNKRFELQDVVPGGETFRNYYPYSVYGHFVDNKFIVVQNDTVFAYDTQTKTPIATQSDIASILSARHLSTKADVRRARWTSTDNVWIRLSESFYNVSLSQNKVVDSLKVPQDAQNIDFDHASRRIAYTINNDLFVSDAQGNRRINADSETNVVYGQSVHRNEFGINKGTFWSPDGSKLAFYRMDESMVADYPIVNIDRRIATAEPIKYPMAGCTSHEVRIGVYDPIAKTDLYLKTESPKDRYFTNISWTPDGAQIMVAEINREQNHMWFNVYDAQTGNFVKTLFEETDEQWVEPCNPAQFINRTSRFVWQSERDGFNHLYLYDYKTGNCNQLTSGSWDVTEYYGCDAKGENIFFQSTERGYLERHIYKLNIKTRKMSRLTDGFAVFSATFSPDCSAWIENMSSMSVARRATFRSGKKSKIIMENKQPYSGFKMPEIRLVDLKSADGNHSLTGRLILPPDFDANKKYPVICYVYGGPHSQLVDASWLAGASTWKLYFAQQGYIVFTMDNRGTDGHGLEFKQAIHRRLNECEMADQMQGIEYLKSQPFVDENRIGVHGWSYGGFMTVSMMLNHPETFKVGVAGGPVINWQLYEVMYGERYMDTPQENPDGYAANDLCSQVSNLQGRLLVIHGDIDPVVVWQNSLSLLKSSVDKGVMIDYAVYPGHEHNVIGPDRVHLIKRILRYFEDYLK